MALVRSNYLYKDTDQLHSRTVSHGGSTVRDITVYITF